MSSAPSGQRRPAIHWFRQDLRLSDNPALCAAAEFGDVLPVFILDGTAPGEYAPGAASRWWLHYSLLALNRSLHGRLITAHGDPDVILPALAEQHCAGAVFWNRCYEPWQVTRDERLERRLRDSGLLVVVSNGSLLWDPEHVRKADGSPYRVFTPFYQKRCLTAAPPRVPLPAPAPLRVFAPTFDPQSIHDLGLLPRIRWDRGLEPHWTIGERGAQKRLEAFLCKGLDGYSTRRDYPAQPHVSRLSPHLHFGEISPNQAWYAVRAAGDGIDVEHFCRELAWREFAHGLLVHFPDLPSQCLQQKFDSFPWRCDDVALKCWQQGQTGVPIVDAGMRELWQTGCMHNRVRMIVGSFLVKNLLLDWRNGAAWFRDCLVDADVANNVANWQWIAGCGADAAPYFRIFNPVTQGRKFDPAGDYTRRFVPELAALPDRYLFDPWRAPAPVLRAAGITLGTTYPEPLVDLQVSRKRALDVFRSLAAAPNGSRERESK
jgi:deoxyribodipyrimidine photo-lyase